MISEIEVNFDAYLKSGEAEEKKVLKIIQELYDFSAYMTEGNFPDYDIVMPMSGITIEVKRDFRSEITQNLAFEIRFKGNKSGLASTKADIWVTADEHYLYFFSVRLLREWFKEKCKSNVFRIVKGGDDNMSEMIIVNRNEITNNEFCAVVCKNGSNLNVLKYFFKFYLQMPCQIIKKAL